MANKYRSLKAHPGIRVDQKNNYLAEKMVGGQRYSKKFKSLREAKFWRTNFHPTICPEPNSSNPLSGKEQPFRNGDDTHITLGDLIVKYENIGMESLSKLTKSKKLRSISNLVKNIEDVRLCDLSAEMLAYHIKGLKKNADPQRCSFDRELKDLSSVFNWHVGLEKSKGRSFNNPIVPFHYSVGRIRTIQKKPKDIEPHEFLLFLGAFTEKKPDRKYRNMAIIHYFTAGRVGEAAAIKLDVIDLKKRILTIKRNVEWVKGEVPNVKDSTKTYEQRQVWITDWMLKAIKDQMELADPESGLLFHKDGSPLHQKAIIASYNRALKRANLPYTGTHILRYGCATTSRELNDIDHAQSVTGHASVRMLEQYAQNKKSLNKNRTALTAVENHLKSLMGPSKTRAKITTDYDQMDSNELNVLDFAGGK